MPPSCVTGEVSCFPHRQLIFRFGRRVISSFERSLRVHFEIDSVCLSVPRSSNYRCADSKILANADSSKYTYTDSLNTQLYIISFCNYRHLIHFLMRPAYLASQNTSLYICRRRRAFLYSKPSMLIRKFRQ